MLEILVVELFKRRPIPDNDEVQFGHVLASPSVFVQVGDPCPVVDDLDYSSGLEHHPSPALTEVGGIHPLYPLYPY
jgi:hypothetical protein